MPMWLIGGLIGLALGGVTWLVLGMVINGMDHSGRMDKSHPGHRIQQIRKLDLITMPIICAVIAHFAFGEG